MSVDYHGIGTSIKDHLVSELGTDYYITQNISQAIAVQTQSCAILVTFQSFNTQEMMSLSPNQPCRTATYLIGIIARKDTDELQDETIDDVIALVEEALNPPTHGYPIYGETGVEKALVQSASKMVDNQVGITATITLQITLMEEA